MANTSPTQQPWYTHYTHLNTVISTLEFLPQPIQFSIADGLSTMMQRYQAKTSTKNLRSLGADEILRLYKSRQNGEESTQIPFQVSKTIATFQFLPTVMIQYLNLKCVNLAAYLSAWRQKNMPELDLDLLSKNLDFVFHVSDQQLIQLIHLAENRLQPAIQPVQKTTSSNLSVSPAKPAEHKAPKASDEKHVILGDLIRHSKSP